MTAKQMAVAIGQTVQLRCDGLNIDCIVVDAKESWGRPRVQIRPVAGSGSRWVELSSLVAAVGHAGITHRRIEK